MALQITWSIHAAELNKDEFPPHVEITGPVEEGPDWMVYRVTEPIESARWNGEELVIDPLDGDRVYVEMGVHPFVITSR